MRAPDKAGHRASAQFPCVLLADSAFKEPAVSTADRQPYLEREAAHWGRLLTLMEGHQGGEARRCSKKGTAKKHGLPDLSPAFGEALVNRMKDLDKGGVEFSKKLGRRSVKRAVCELLAALPELDRTVLEDLRSVLDGVRSSCGSRNLRLALDAAIEHLDILGEREMSPAGCYVEHRTAFANALPEGSRGNERTVALSLLTCAISCAMEGRGQELRTGLKALLGFYAENNLSREALSQLSIQLLAQCQVVSLAQFDEMPREIVRSVQDLLKQFRTPLVSGVEREIMSVSSEDAIDVHDEPLPDARTAVPLFERLPWWLRSAPNGMREGACHWIALLFAVWAVQTAIEAFVDGVDGHAWPPVTILGLVVALSFIGFDQFFQKKIVDRQAFRPQPDAQLGRYAKSKCFNLMRWTSLVQPWVLPAGFFVFGLAAFDAQARLPDLAEFNGTSAFEPEPWQSSLLPPNASQHADPYAIACEIAAAMAMSAERFGYAWQCALIPVQAQITGLIARLLRDLLQSGTRSRWTSGLSLCRRIINEEGDAEFIKLTDGEQWRVWLLRDILYGLSSMATLGVGQAYGKGLISLIQLRSCLAHEAIGIEFKSVYGPMNEAADGFWPDLANKLVEWWPGLVGLESPSDQPLVCVVDRQSCIVGDKDGVRNFREHFVRNTSARVATASVGNDDFGSLATLCTRLGHPEVAAFFLMVGAVFNALTGGARAHCQLPGRSGQISPPRHRHSCGRDDRHPGIVDESHLADTPDTAGASHPRQPGETACDRTDVQG